ncbi:MULTISPECIES: hypothetical protein [unclassified Burkholderia]|uniref:hypothetical protein n=1 Tax=unclassified Burkholderia TaxID=2613784 RepID=UPI00075B112E|nr:MULTISPECIES: hypothetical protein [unclassified Burkholderia]KUY93976.1 hypothetical protein WS48_23025 [Burkholderia sp. RF7-non_BP1]KUY97431.1 hypothetical protein WS49_19935 [Burkholderia sp. RF7-non_BP4]
MKDDGGNMMALWALSREAVCDLGNIFKVIEEFTIPNLARQVQMSESLAATRAGVPQSPSISEQCYRE